MNFRRVVSFTDEYAAPGLKAIRLGSLSRTTFLQKWWTLMCPCLRLSPSWTMSCHLRPPLLPDLLSFNCLPGISWCWSITWSPQSQKPSQSLKVMAATTLYGMSGKSPGSNRTCQSTKSRIAELDTIAIKDRDLCFRLWGLKVIIAVLIGRLTDMLHGKEDSSKENNNRKRLSKKYSEKNCYNQSKTN